MNAAARTVWSLCVRVCSQVEVSSLLILSHLEELSDGDPVEGVCLLAAKHLEEHVLHIGEVRSLGRPAGPANGANILSNRL